MTVPAAPLPRVAARLELAAGIAAAAALAAVLLGGAWASAPRGGLGALFSVPERALLVAAVASGGMAVVVAPGPRLRIAAACMAGLLALATIAAVGPIGAGLVVLVVGMAQASPLAGEAFPARLRGPAAGALLLMAGGLLARSPQLGAQRVAGAALALAIAALAGMVPFLRTWDPEQPVAGSAAAWSGFVAPLVALATAAEAASRLSPEGRAGFGAVLIAVGIFNAAWGSAGAWAAAKPVSGWRYSFVADWGLALVGLGLATQDGARAAYLLLLVLIVCRLPLYLCALPRLRGEAKAPADVMSVVVGFALAGAAPFAGFPARIWLLSAATHVGWPLALVLGLLMLAWLPGSIRVARTLGRPQGAALWVVRLTLAVSIAIGIYPAAFLVGQ